MDGYDSDFYDYNEQVDLQNATAVLVLGIVSIVLCWCYGIIGLITGVIALFLAEKDRRKYMLEPEAYTKHSYKNLMAGRTVAIVGVCLSGLFFIIVLIGALFNIIEDVPFGDF